MATLLRLVSKLPMPRARKLEWQRVLLDRCFAKEIAEAKTKKDPETVESLQRDHQFEMQMHAEEEDAFLTRRLLVQARKLRVPVPHRFNTDNSESEHWYEGQYTHGWYLTTKGIAALREELRKEAKARHEARSHWFVWLSGVTGLLGAATGLISLLVKKGP